MELIKRKSLLRFGFTWLLLGVMACGGGNNITFPQGPTSGAGDLGSLLPLLTIEPNPAFDMTATYNATSDSFTFSFGGAASRACSLHRLVLVFTLTQPDPGITQVTQISLVQETKDFVIYSGPLVSSFVRNHPSTLSALLLCIPAEGFSGTYARSSFVEVTRFFPNR